MEDDRFADLEVRFRGFASYSASPLYSRLSEEVADVHEVTGLLLEAAPAQRWPMLLLASVNLLTGRSGEPFPLDGEELVSYCRGHREELLATIGSRATQTNEVARCAYLLPCFCALDDGRPLAMIEVGASRGLVLNWDRYRYDYNGRPAGDPASPLEIPCELRSGQPELSLPGVTSRIGVDLDPMPEEDWLRACVFHDQPDRRRRLELALEIATTHPAKVVRADALEVLPELIAAAPSGSRVVVFHTAVAVYLSEEEAERLGELTAGVTYVTAEHQGADQHFTLRINGEEVGRAHPHGSWLEWGSPPPGSLSGP